MEYQIPRKALFYLILSLSFVSLPHLERAPLVLPCIWALACFWQFKIYKQQWQQPHWPIKFALVLIAFSAVIFQYKGFANLQAVTQTLIIGLLLKLLEMKQLRDVLIMVYLAYFAVVTQLLFSQSIFTALYVIMALLLVTACLVSLYQDDAEVKRAQAIQVAMKMMSLSIPLMLVAFIVFPRIPPLWSVPSLSKASKTGISNRMSPGLINQLFESNELSFRVVFDEPTQAPPSSQMYWRAVVMDYYDGETWSPSDSDWPIAFAHEDTGDTIVDNGLVKPGEEDGQEQNQEQEQQQQDPLSESLDQTTKLEPLHYTITQEASNQPYLLHLDHLLNSSVGQFYSNRLLKRQHVIDERIQYQLSSDLGRSRLSTQGLQDFLYKTNTQLPSGFNPQTLAFAQSFRQNFESDEAYIAALLKKIHREEYYYTHKPEALGKHRVDDFLFKSREGYCEHFSQAFVVLLRAVGIPARIVAGYQGGELNPYENYWMVREKDAHAWVEVWLEGKGWQRYDPTFAVAFERILVDGESILEDAVNAAQSNARNMSLAHEQGVIATWTKSLQLKMDQLNFYWQQKVLNFKAEQQKILLTKLLGQVDYLRIALFILLVFVLVAAAFFMFSFFMNRSEKAVVSAEYRLYLALAKKLTRYGIVFKPAEGPQDYFERIVAESVSTIRSRSESNTKRLSEDQIDQLSAFFHAYNIIMYADLAQNNSEQYPVYLHRLKQVLRQF